MPVPLCTRSRRMHVGAYLSLVALVACWLIAAGCGPPQAQRGRRSAGAGGGKRAEGDALLASVAESLNDLAERNDLNLAPAEPVLTAANSSDGREIRAIITPNPASPETGVNYLRVTTGNANFRTLGVRPLDVVRIYYVKVDDADEESRQMQEMGIQERDSIEIPVRRLDLQDPESALLLGVELNQAVEYPERVEIWRYSDKRMERIRWALDQYDVNREPPLGWEPTPDAGALAQLVERANQWLRNIGSPADPWPAPPLVDSWPAELRTAKGATEAIAPTNLDGGLFADYEGRLLQQAVWTRDVAAWARGPAVTDADTAAALFDWVVRNIQLDDPDAARTIHLPWQALAYGHGSADHRAWVFVELCRQLRIPAAMMAFAPAADAKPARAFPAALGEQGWLLFDPEYGLPLPGAGGIATLTELKANPALVRAFDVPGAPYPLAESDLAHVTAQIVASPLQLTRRAARLEAALKGEQLVFLTANVPGMVERLKSAPIDATSLWPGTLAGLAGAYSTRSSTRTAEVEQFAPFAQAPELWKARTLHFMGHKDVPRDRRDDPLATPKEGHRDAIPLYYHERVLMPEARLAALDPAKRAVSIAAKRAASYWLGLLSYDLGNLEAARNWLDKRTLQAAHDGPWREGARYNLARTLARLAESDAEGGSELFAAAIKLLEETPRTAPQWPGNQALARQWSAQISSPAESPAVDDVP
ncbi:MAG: hypothetical protein KF847_13470 [Pirellulales bacterium]|nr:hypothetical protein [Pirellulales bacterium]